MIRDKNLKTNKPVVEIGYTQNGVNVYYGDKYARDDIEILQKKISAQMNVIEVIKLGSQELPVNSKIVVIPVDSVLNTASANLLPNSLITTEFNAVKQLIQTNANNIAANSNTIGTLTNLTTNNKRTIVEAINELHTELVGLENVAATKENVKTIHDAVFNVDGTSKISKDYKDLINTPMEYLYLRDTTSDDTENVLRELEIDGEKWKIDPGLSAADVEKLISNFLIENYGNGNTEEF